nr:hypothetical protein [Streptomyces californicus]
MPATPRRRPATRKGRPVLTREIIAAKALEMAGDQGSPLSRCAPSPPNST